MFSGWNYIRCLPKRTFLILLWCFLQYIWDIILFFLSKSQKLLSPCITFFWYYHNSLTVFLFLYIPYAKVHTCVSINQLWPFLDILGYFSNAKMGKWVIKTQLNYICKKSRFKQSVIIFWLLWYYSRVTTHIVEGWTFNSVFQLLEKTRLEALRLLSRQANFNWVLCLF